MTGAIVLPGRKELGSIVLISLPCLVLIAFYVYPIVRVLAMSVTEPSFGFQNYEKLLSNESIHGVLATTVRICALTTLLSMVGGYLIAYVMIQVGRTQRSWMLLFVLVPFWVSVLVRAFSWLALFHPNGLLNSFLISTNLIASPIEMRSETNVVIAMVHYMLPFAILPLYSTLRNIDPQYVAAARSMGCTPIQAFVKVFLPLSLPGIVGTGLLVLILTLGFFVTPALLGGGKVVMIAEYTSVQLLQLTRWGVAAMLSVVLLLSVLAALVLLARLIDLGRLFGGRPT